MLLVFALTLFVSATLLFLVQPMIGKMITPMLGGSPAVWNTCMVFFQAMLLAGYAYAHAITRWLGIRAQAVLHVCLLAIPFVVLPIAVNQELAPSGESNPILGVLLLLLISVGLPFFVVSASAPLLQKWFAATLHPAARDPYFLYGASNLGSMMALVAYPLIVERKLVLPSQSWCWMVGYGALVGLTIVCAILIWRTAGQKPVGNISPTSQGDAPITIWRRLHWLALAFVPSSLMLGATTYISTDIAAIPLLWVLPLALYLLSFILVFSRSVGALLTLAAIAVAGGVLGVFIKAIFLILVAALLLLLGLTIVCFRGWLQQKPWARELNDYLGDLPGVIHKLMVLGLPLVVLLLVFMMLSELRPRQWAYLAWHLMVLWVVAMVCHGELARLRPGTARLTEFYLWMSVGGVLGGVFNALIAPLLFRGVVEYELAIVLACVLMPPLGTASLARFGFKLDLILAACLAVAAFAVFFTAMHSAVEDAADLLAIKNPSQSEIDDLEYYNQGIMQVRLGQVTVVAFTLAVPLGFLLARRPKWQTLWFDVMLPVGLGLLGAALLWAYTLVEWDLSLPRRWIARLTGDRVYTSSSEMKLIVVFAVPALVSYLFVERPLRFGLAVAALFVVGALPDLVQSTRIHQERSYFGVMTVHQLIRNHEGRKQEYHRLVHGSTIHGEQCWELGRRGEPLTYYHRNGPIGRLLAAYPEAARNFAVVGLGTGSMAAYGGPGRKVTFYEIDRHVRDIALNPDYFTYLADYQERRGGEQAEIILGDARLQLEKVHLEDNYSMIVVDAFSSDAIPVHLLTVEAMKVYLSHLTEEGFVAFHISNRFLDLKPVLGNLAKELGLVGLVGRCRRGYEDDRFPATWVVLARRKEYLERLGLFESQVATRLLTHWPTPILSAHAAALHTVCYRMSWDPVKERPDVGVWTDKYSNVLRVFAWDTN
jgi:hypothetical protein